jgi:O-antigen/teichoic acid export membrane protein
VFTWVIISVDKFIGAGRLTDKTEVALLALAMQLVLPISVLADMIRMAIGPYIMSIRKDHDAEKSYQQIYDLCIFTSAIVVVGIILMAPILTLILANKTYLNVIYVIPLMALAQMISLAANQFGINFSLVKKTIYILYAIIIAGTISTLINILFMKDYGFVVSGYSQVVSYLAMASFMFIFGKRVANLQIKLKNSLYIFVIVIGYIISLHFLSPLIEKGDFLIFFIVGILCIITLFFIYFKQQKLNPLVLISALKEKFRKKS